MKKNIKNFFKKMFSFETTKEVIMFHIIILLLTVLPLFELSEREKYIWTNTIPIIVSISCSILAAALLPKVVQKKDFCNLENNLVRRIADIFNMNKYTSPTATYADTNDPNMEFNEKVNRSISETYNYIYFSDRALYLTKRLGRDIQKTNNHLSIKVLLADVRETDLFEARSKVYMQRIRALHKEGLAQKELIHGKKSLKKIIKKEKLKVLRSLYALGQLQEKYDIQVYLHKEIPFIRFEITDSLLVLTFLTKLSTGKKYPSTLIYENENIFRSNFMEYAQEVINRSYHMSEEELQLDKLIELGKTAKIWGCNKEMIVSHYNENVKI